ncbi:hypothetical protein WJX84_007569 [Apatococcus fuscideae]|uniref:m7GpppX diphosphatase n=1 Tax=Apatococcus fuscideae TaxID=2026836 RepID=A0AAW1T2X0_9CHLO
MQSLDGYVLEEVLSQDARSKSVALLGRFKDKEGQALVRLSKQQFELEKHISKHREQTYCMVKETPEMYRLVHQPYILSIPSSRIQWVYNMLEGKAEQERMIFHDPDPDTGFMLHPDLKWNQLQRESMYCLAICNRRDIRCLRDLKAVHVPMLQSIESKSLQAIQQKWGVAAEHIRAYFHYPPSYYHLHIHFCHVHFEGPGMAAGKAHLLSDIIDMLNLKPDLLQQRTFQFTVGQRDPLWKACNSMPSALDTAAEPSKRRRTS